jgi:hypothetical protein
VSRHDRAYGVYYAPGSKGGNGRRKAGTGVSKTFRSGRASRYAAKRERRQNNG